MNVRRYDDSGVVDLLRRQKVATMPELKAALGSSVDMTVFRRLKELSYRTSYSHGSRYYTLDDVAEFDERGLWSFGSIRFSRFGTLVATLEALVSEAESGYYSRELKRLLHVEVKETLLRLIKRHRLARDRVEGAYLYCSADPEVRKQQILARRLGSAEVQEPRAGVEDGRDEVKAAIILFDSLLDEKQRRLFAGLEALRLGPRSDHRIADLLGLHYQTVAKGRRQLLQGDVEVERVRRAGGGRKPVEKKRRK